MSDMIQITSKELEDIQKKAEKWDKLGDKIARYYETEDEDGNEIAAEKQGDLCDIGLAAAAAYGWL